MNRRLFLFPSLFRDSRPTSRSAGMKTHSRVIRSLRYRNRIQPVCFQQRAILFCMRARFCSFQNARVSICLLCICNIGGVYMKARARRPDTQSIKFVRHFTHYLVTNSITALFMPYRGWSRNTGYTGWLVSDRIYLLPCIQLYKDRVTKLSQNRRHGDTLSFFCFCAIPSIFLFFFLNWLIFWFYIPWNFHFYVNCFLLSFGIVIRFVK